MTPIEKGKLLLQTLEALQSKLMGEPVDKEDLESLSSGLSKVAISEADVEIATIYALAVQGVLLSYPHPGRSVQFKKPIQHLYDEVKKRIAGLSNEKKATVGWNVPGK